MIELLERLAGGAAEQLLIFWPFLLFFGALALWLVHDWRAYCASCEQLRRGPASTSTSSRASSWWAGDAPDWSWPGRAR